MSPAATSNQIIARRLAAADTGLSELQVQQLARFLGLLMQWNRVYNLTGIRDIDSLIERNMLECLALRQWLAGERIADVGTGAGLPGVPLAIAEPGRQFTLIESRAKRVHFLRHVCGDLALQNVEIAHSRAEDLPTGLAFDTVLARAVAPPVELLALARHLTVPGSLLLMLTSVDKSAEYKNLVTDFAVRTIEPADTAGLQGAVVRLERIDV